MPQWTNWLASSQQSRGPVPTYKLQSGCPFLAAVPCLTAQGNIWAEIRMIKESGSQNTKCCRSVEIWVPTWRNSSLTTNTFTISQLTVAAAVLVLVCTTQSHKTTTRLIRTVTAIKGGVVERMNASQTTTVADKLMAHHGRVLMAQHGRVVDSSHAVGIPTRIMADLKRDVKTTNQTPTAIAVTNTIYRVARPLCRPLWMPQPLLWASQTMCRTTRKTW